MTLHGDVTAIAAAAAAAAAAVALLEVFNQSSLIELGCTTKINFTLFALALTIKVN